jgi:ubiquitin carboxyl-terminal hydrolase 9/24
VLTTLFGVFEQTVLRTAISTLPNVLILSLKRFDLDFTTFETVKLNSRCAFDQTLNMKDYTLEGLEAKERDVAASDTSVSMDADLLNQINVKTASDREKLSDKDYEYRLAGVLVHAGVAQGGHYYSFIRERTPGSEDKWYRFDDEDVTPFDPAKIETECFGGRVKKETKWPNGQVHTVEQEQFANALMLFYERVKPSDPPADASQTQNVLCPMSSGYDVFKADVRLSNAAHRWQAFLFDSEFQFFLKRLLGFCAVPSPFSVPPQVWREPLLRVLLMYFFDVMPYSVERSYVHDWVNTLEQALSIDTASARSFVRSLSRKTGTVSSNWFRTFLMECPDQVTRGGAVRIFNAGIRSCLTFQQERLELAAWTKAWVDLSETVQDGIGSPVPSRLTGRLASHEDVGFLQQGGSSSVGILLTYINVLLDAFPRCWRFSSELIRLIRLLAAMLVEHEYLLRQPLIAAMVPMRLIAIALRDRLLPHSLQVAFPGASLSGEIANTQTRPEASHAYAVSMTGNHIHPNENNLRGPGVDYPSIFEALACLASVPGALTLVLVVDSGEMGRGGRRRYTLTEAATQALTTIFQEHCAPGSPGMSRRELEYFIHLCGIETTHAISQRCADMMRRSAIDDTAQGPKYLALTGFLTYYRDMVQNNDIQLRAELSFLGFRPDLSRRSESARMAQVDGRLSYRDLCESIAMDVAEVFGESRMSLGALADMATIFSWNLYETAFIFSDLHALYFLAAVSFQRDVSELIHQILQAMFAASTDWQGNDKVAMLTQALKVIASVPDRYQSIKIGLIMESALHQRDAENGTGLLSVLRFCKQARSTHPYHQQFQWIFNRYIAVLKSLLKCSCISQWMLVNKSSWAFIEHSLSDDRTSDHHIRDDSMAPDTLGTYGPHHMGDRNIDQTDMDISNINEDSEEDDDSHFGDQLVNGDLTNDNDSTMYQLEPGMFAIEVRGAGSYIVNGVYEHDGQLLGVNRYFRRGQADDGKEVRLFISRCDVSNNTKHWYISIVPSDSLPGTSADLDFYTAPCTDEYAVTPPQNGWVATTTGRSPAPFLIYRPEPSPVDDDDDSFDHYPDVQDSAGGNDDITSYA